MARSKRFTVAAVAFALASCGSDSTVSDDGETAPTVAVPTTPVEAAPVEADLTRPSTPDEAAALVVGLLDGAALTPADFDAIFAPVFREAIGFDDFSSLLVQVAGEGPWTLGEPRTSTDTTGTYEIVSDAGAVVLLDVAVSDEGISGLLLSPDQAFEAPETVEEAIDRLQALGDLRLAVTDASQGACAPVIDEGINEVMPLGSAFKLYVLGAVVAAMDDGSIGWDTDVEIRDDLDSLPSGTTQEVEPGTVMTVRELAESMISISDNTATDHLIDLVGRDAVEAALVPMGNDAIERNRPFLTTRELFVLKFGEPALGQRYAAADTATRRSILADEVAGAPLPDVALVDPSVPVLVEELEWFASPLAMCDAMVWLVADPTALEILALNPGVPPTSPTWETLAFKGGSEPGLMTMVWWTSTDDGRAFVTAGSVASSTGPIDEFEAANLFAFLRDEGPALEEVAGSD